VSIWPPAFGVLWRLLVVFLCLFIPDALAQEEQLVVRFNSPVQVVDPGENLTLVVTVQNNTGEQLRAHSELELPEGWRPVIPLGQLVLASGAQQVIPFVLQTSPATPPGEHRVTVQVTPQDDSHEFGPVTASQSVEVATVVEEGERYLQIMPGQLPGDWSVAPANLVLVEVVPGEEHRVDLQAAPTAQVRGRFVYRAPDDAGEDVILGMAGPAAGERALSGIRVQARMGERVRSVTSDSAGNFGFDMLPYGEWQLSVSAPQLEGYYRIEPAVLQLELAPGEEREVEISVIPVPRRLQIFDGGTIGVP